jgi:hypothetical protein
MTDEEAARVATAVENMVDGLTITLANSVRELTAELRRMVDRDPESRRDMHTVGDLRKLIANVPDDALVVLDDGQGWYVHVAEIKYGAPDDDGYTEWPCFTIFGGQPFDPRDL